MDADESVLDVEWSHSIAPGAKILFGVSPPDAGDDLFATVEYMVNNGLANFISLSWGEPEDAMDPFYALAYHEIFLQAAAEGIGVFASSGDSGAYEDVVGYPYQSALYPSVDPMVTGWAGRAITYSRGTAMSLPSPGTSTTSGCRHTSTTSSSGEPGAVTPYSTQCPPCINTSTRLEDPCLMEGYRFFERSSFLPFIWGYLINGGPVPTEGLPWYRAVEYLLEPGLYSPVGGPGGATPTWPLTPTP